jgi:diacylglycerol kinase family enzyme
MKMAPTAKLDDGLIDLLLITTASTLDMMTIFRKVYDGSHTSTSTHQNTHTTPHALKECETQQNCRTSGTSR